MVCGGDQTGVGNRLVAPFETHHRKPVTATKAG
jgi:hypothetical protein